MRALLSRFGWALVALGCQGAAQRGGASAGPSVAYHQSSGYEPTAASAPRYSAIVEAVRGAGLGVSPDEALGAVAEAVAARMVRDGNGRTPSARVVQALAWQRGVSDPIPTVLAFFGQAGAVTPDLGREVSALVRSDGLTHLGVASSRDGAHEAVVVVLSQRRVRLESMPSRAAVGARLALRGSLLAGLRTPALAVTRPDGHAEETPLGEGPDFFGQLPLNARGVWQVELTAEGPSGSTVVANFPVYVEVEPPATPDEQSGGAAEAPEVVEAALLESLNAARRAAHLRPLEPLAALVAVSRAHAAEMASGHFVAHNSADGTTPGERLRRAGLQSGLSLENVGRGYSARELHDGLMASPGHRANILNPTVTHVGIGVVRESGPSGGLIVSQDFIEVAAAIDAAAAARTLVEGINRNRVARGQPAFAANATLSAAAQEAATAFFANPGRSQEDVLGAVSQRLSRESLLFRRIGVTAAFGPRLDGADRLEPLFDRDMRMLGVGVAQGDRRNAPPNSVFVVYVMAMPR
ncbi:MAG: CAP domain-containing protein [Myxococcales bacterium]|nr:CAP domain-containing protein [Myxococcales bacterium]